MRRLHHYGSVKQFFDSLKANPKYFLNTSVGMLVYENKWNN